ncbi:hypothetical protein CEXT_739331 [Caerostris extrusa]|uniref:Uncharacterized protein n=1 Tax=Caerostris extrusa TaxID=172846 RepID=A0AAV4R4H5_CAEEX|nr:hypothetical protein CEXT_739331 [Caerostris extrusa]
MRRAFHFSHITIEHEKVAKTDWRRRNRKTAHPHPISTFFSPLNPLQLRFHRFLLSLESSMHGLLQEKFLVGHRKRVQKLGKGLFTGWEIVEVLIRKTRPLSCGMARFGQDNRWNETLG